MLPRRPYTPIVASPPRPLATTFPIPAPRTDQQNPALQAPAVRDPEAGGGVPQLVRVDFPDPGFLASPPDHLGDPVAGERLAAGAEPQPWQVRQRVTGADPQVAGEGLA